MFLIPRWVRITLFAIFALALASYALFQARFYIQGPQLHVTTPQNGVILSDPNVIVSGKAIRIDALSLNGRSIYTDPDGNFHEELLLPYGYSILTLAARDRFGRTIRRELEVTYK